MSDRSDDRRYPLRRLFGVAPLATNEPCLRCHKPETSRVIMVCGDAGWHKTILHQIGFDNELASALVSDRWIEQVKPMLESMHRLAAEAGHPEWLPLPATVAELLAKRVPLQWRICRGCAQKAEPPLHTISAKRLHAILGDQRAEGGMIPHVVMQPPGDGAS